MRRVTSLPWRKEAIRLFAATGEGLYDRVAAQIERAFPGQDTSPGLTAEQLAEFCTFLEFLELREHAGGERWSDHGSREKLAVKFFLSKALAQATPGAKSVPPLYRRFARELQLDDIVLTFNWDCLLENALDAENRPYTYEFEADKIILWKPHGSVHWRLGHPDQSSILDRTTLQWLRLDWRTEMVRNDVHYSDELRNPEAWGGRRPLRDIKPLLVLPGFGKAYDVRDISPLWYKIEGAFGFTEDVYIIGLGLPADDYFVRSFFLDNLPFDQVVWPNREVTIINPSADVEKTFGFLLGTPRVEWLREAFSDEHIDRMAERRAQREAET